MTYDPVTYWSNRKNPDYKGDDPRHKGTPQWVDDYIVRHTLPDRILDYGTGEGGKVHLFSGMSVVGMDIVSTYAVRARKQAGDIDYLHVVGDVSGLHAGQFDTALCSKVLLHVPDNDICRVTDHLKRVAGRIIVWDIDMDTKAPHVFNHDFSKLFNMKDVIRKDGQILFHT